MDPTDSRNTNPAENFFPDKTFFSDDSKQGKKGNFGRIEILDIWRKKT
jgi:hypothetical protein